MLTQITKPNHVFTWFNFETLNFETSHQNYIINDSPELSNICCRNGLLTQPAVVCHNITNL